MKKERFVKVRKFVEEHEKPILIIGGALVTGVIAFIGCNALGQRDPERYTTRWYEGLSDDEWQGEREKTRLAMRDAHDDWKLADEMDFRLRRFDDEWRRRKDDGTDDCVSPPHREHGNNLYKPD